MSTKNTFIECQTKKTKTETQQQWVLNKPYIMQNTFCISYTDNSLRSIA